MRLDTGELLSSSLDTAREMIGMEAIRERQDGASPDGRAIGGLCLLHRAKRPRHDRMGASASCAWCRVMDAANVRMLPDGSRDAACRRAEPRPGPRDYAAADRAHELRLDPSQISVRYGDTATAPFGFGTFASRSIVFAGGAVARTCRTHSRENPAYRRASAADRHRQHASKRGAVPACTAASTLPKSPMRANVRQEHLPVLYGSAARCHTPTCEPIGDQRRVRLRHPRRRASRSSPTPA